MVIAKSDDELLTPSVGDARRIAKASHLRRCVILFETSSGRVGHSSYGEIMKLCGSTKKIMGGFFEGTEQRIHLVSAVRARSGS